MTTTFECLKATLTRREPRVFTIEARGPSLERMQSGDFGEIKEVLARLEAACEKTPEARFRRYSGPEAGE